MHEKAQRAEIFVTKTAYYILSKTPSAVVAAAKMSPLTGFTGFVTISFARIITSRWGHCGAHWTIPKNNDALRKE